MGQFTIREDGDREEYRYWSLFLALEFPSYEGFWRDRIVPLTFRDEDRRNIRFRPQAELEARGHTEEDVAVAQLHYTLLIHLGRVFDLRAEGLNDRHRFAEAFARLHAALDVADELLGRRREPGRWKPWDERDGEKARRMWRDLGAHPLRERGHPLWEVGRYRNRLTHGRVVPEFPVWDGMRAVLFYPRLDKVDEYLDWRNAFNRKSRALEDFAPADSIVNEAWGRVVAYVEGEWRAHLVSHTL